MLVRGKTIPITNITINRLIDYVKISLQKIDVDSLLKALDFITEYKENTGEVSGKRIAEYHFCKITIYDSGLVLFTGSIHKLWNSINNIKAPNYKDSKKDNGYNGNQFSINNIIEVREHLTSLFDCEPQQMRFQNIEFGINTTPKFNPQQFIKGLLYHNSKQFEFSFNGYFAQVKHQRYFIKIYNKSNQYQLDDFTLRVELKIIKTEEIKNIGIKTFNDINEATLLKAKEHLLTRLDEVVYYDYTISKKGLSKKQKSSLTIYSNPRYWLDLKPKNRDYNKRKLREYILNFSDNLKAQIQYDINNKFGIINRLSDNKEFRRINHSIIELTNTNKPPQLKSKICPITKVDIHRQKSNSYLLSYSGLKHLYSTDRSKYSEIKTKHLSNKWAGTEFNIEIREIAHKIRGFIRSQRRKQVRLYQKYQFRLFKRFLKI